MIKKLLLPLFLFSAATTSFVYGTSTNETKDSNQRKVPLFLLKFYQKKRNILPQSNSIPFQLDVKTWGEVPNKICSDIGITYNQEEHLFSYKTRSEKPYCPIDENISNKKIDFPTNHFFFVKMDLVGENCTKDKNAIIKKCHSKEEEEGQQIKPLNSNPNSNPFIPQSKTVDTSKTDNKSKESFKKNDSSLIKKRGRVIVVILIVVAFSGGVYYLVFKPKKEPTIAKKGEKEANEENI